MSKPPKEQARDYVWHNYGKGDFNEYNWDRSAEEIWLAGYKAGREMSNKEIFDYYLELRKKHGQQEPEHKPIVEKFSLTLIEKKGFF